MLEVSSGLVKSVIFDRQIVLENKHPHPPQQTTWVTWLGEACKFASLKS